jgi:hypothetical protein
MSTATLTEAPATSVAPAAPAVPAAPPAGLELPDWLDGATEILLPSERHLKAYWDADIIDVDDRNRHDTIIEREDPFEVRFRVYLKGRLWSCISGHWCFDVGFTAIGDGPDFNLSDVLPDPGRLQVADWSGCRSRYIDLCVPVPRCSIPVEHCGTLYQVGAKFEMRCCGSCSDRSSHPTLVGHEPQGEYMFV